MIPSDVRILVCTDPQDMRRSFDGLCLVVEQYVGADPKSGALFGFTNKRKNRLKVRWFDRNGFCILYTRLHREWFEDRGPRCMLLACVDDATSRLATPLCVVVMPGESTTVAVRLEPSVDR